MGKTRNALIREWTIPRRQLQVVVLATRMSKTILKKLDFQVHETYFWSDPMTSLHYIKNEMRRFQTFVVNRVSEIHETTSPEQWHHIPGVMNPVDEGSRGFSAEYSKQIVGGGQSRNSSGNQNIHGHQCPSEKHKMTTRNFESPQTSC
ncbi:uncharacterized protein [Montipora foliosa]|uniref:uncharacterized protein n=1 Tax=Montipora foliosa TaxID=591990 RepID=UPI0035F159D1